eukprot:PhM_4_TR14618/c2_g2_i3/m.84371
MRGLRRCVHGGTGHANLQCLQARVAHSVPSQRPAPSGEQRQGVEVSDLRHAGTEGELCAVHVGPEGHDGAVWPRYTAQIRCHVRRVQPQVLRRTLKGPRQIRVAVQRLRREAEASRGRLRVPPLQEGRRQGRPQDRLAVQLMQGVFSCFAHRRQAAQGQLCLYRMHGRDSAHQLRPRRLQPRRCAGDVGGATEGDCPTTEATDQAADEGTRKSTDEGTALSASSSRVVDACIGYCTSATAVEDALEGTLQGTDESADEGSRAAPCNGIIYHESTGTAARRPATTTTAKCSRGGFSGGPGKSHPGLGSGGQRHHDAQGRASKQVRSAQAGSGRTVARDTGSAPRDASSPRQGSGSPSPSSADASGARRARDGEAGATLVMGHHVQQGGSDVGGPAPTSAVHGRQTACGTTDRGSGVEGRDEGAATFCAGVAGDELARRVGRGHDDRDPQCEGPAAASVHGADVGL